MVNWSLPSWWPFGPAVKPDFDYANDWPLIDFTVPEPSADCGTVFIPAPVNWRAQLFRHTGLIEWQNGRT
jgi:hypothetical protein